MLIFISERTTYHSLFVPVKFLGLEIDVRCTIFKKKKFWRQKIFAGKKTQKTQIIRRKLNKT